MVEFNCKDVKGITEALWKLVGLVSSSRNARASMIPSPEAHVGARALIRLEATIEMMQHYETVHHQPRTDQLRYNYVVKNIKLEFDALTDRNVVRWAKIFLDFSCLRL